MTKTFWILSISSNAIVVIVSAIIAFICDPELPESNSRNTRFAGCFCFSDIYEAAVESLPGFFDNDVVVIFLIQYFTTIFGLQHHSGL